MGNTGPVILDRVFRGEKNPVSKQPLSAEQILENSLESEMISAEQLQRLNQAQLSNVVLLDVRTTIEHHQGVISGSALFPCDHDLENLENTTIFEKNFHERFQPEQFDQKQRYILICRTGPRTAIALETFLKHGFMTCELLGGVTEWQRLGLPLQPVDIQR